MAGMGAAVTAIDQAERFLNRARERTKENCDRIEYLKLDATDRSAILSLGRDGSMLRSVLWP
jgi:2-polyprenyl-3-methyl-5-hydroxy-6-metoxy-1,4-benzoquinol methylase